MKRDTYVHVSQELSDSWRISVLFWHCVLSSVVLILFWWLRHLYKDTLCTWTLWSTSTNTAPQTLLLEFVNVESFRGKQSYKMKTPESRKVLTGVLYYPKQWSLFSFVSFAGAVSIDNVSLPSVAAGFIRCIRVSFDKQNDLFMTIKFKQMVFAPF